MGKFEGGEERLEKDFASPILEFETERWYINFIIKKIFMYKYLAITSFVFLESLPKNVLIYKVFFIQLISMSIVK